jgi:osmotically-inducible protein OsmY
MKSDTQLQHDVQSELEWEPAIESSHIGVAVKDGIVTLSGTVGSLREKARTEEVTKRVEGVRAVADEITVAVPAGHERTDEEIAATVLDSLAWNSAVDEKRIRVAVSRGWVTLDGTCDWKHQGEAAEKDVRILSGVRGVTNRITVVPRAAPADVKRRIEEAFRRYAALDAGRVQVEVTDSTVKLRGAVHSWAERNQAQEAAWAAPGIVHVENDLLVVP